MWNDWLSSLNGPADEGVKQEMPDPIETPKRFNNPQQLQRLQELQQQHRQLQVQQLHLLNKQHSLCRLQNDASDSGFTDVASTAPHSPTSGPTCAVLAEMSRTPSTSVKSSPPHMDDEEGLTDSEGGDFQDDHDAIKEEGVDENDGNMCIQVAPEVWQQFHAIQAQQWAQALSQARIAKKQTGGPNGVGVMGGMHGFVNGLGTPSSIGLLSSLNGGSGSGGLSSGGKRCKAYAAPKGVWKNNGGYNATIYVHKRRIYGPIRRDLSDAIEDRKEMEDALRELTAIHNSPEDAGILEIEMREVVAGLRNRATPNGCPPPPLMSLGGSSVPSDPPGRKRLRLVTGSSNLAPSTPMSSPEHMPAHLPGGDLTPFESSRHAFNPLSDNDMLDLSHFRGGLTPNMGPLRPDIIYAHLASPGLGFSLGGGPNGQSDLHDCMLPDSLESLGLGLWGAH